MRDRGFDEGRRRWRTRHCAEATFGAHGNSTVLDHRAIFAERPGRLGVRGTGNGRSMGNEANAILRAAQILDSLATWGLHAKIRVRVAQCGSLDIEIAPHEPM